MREMITKEILMFIERDIKVFDVKIKSEELLIKNLNIYLESDTLSDYERIMFERDKKEAKKSITKYKSILKDKLEFKIELLNELETIKGE